MRELHVVAVSDDGRHVVLATSPDAKKGTFRVPLDARLRAAVQGRLTPRPAAATSAADAPTLSVREIQARLRAGESAEEIAASAGVALERVERFAGPVWSEQEKMIEAARATPLLHSRRGLSVLPLGEVVDQHFAQIDSLRPESVSWSARREESGTWLVEVSYVARARTRSGSWRYDPAAGTLVAADSVSASLGHSETTDVAAPAAAKRTRSGGGPRVAARGPSKAAAVPSSVSAKAVAPAPAAPATRARRRPAPPAPPRAPAAVRTTPGTKAPPVVARPGQKVGGPQAPAAEANKDAKATKAPKAPKATNPVKATRPAKATKPAAAKATTPPAAAKPAAEAPNGPPTLRVVPALDQQPRQPPGSRSSSGRASVPAWADVLLSTSPPAADEQKPPGEATSD